MKDRIKRIMDNENLSSTEFADKLQVSRAVISHILNGRNNPSLDVVSKILQEIPYINPDWLINEKGEMYKTGQIPSNKIEKKDLFSEEHVIQDNSSGNADKWQESAVESSKTSDNPTDYKRVITEKVVVKKISQIIIYYDDNTFEKFFPDQK